MKRTTLVTLHLGLAALFLPFLLIIPLSGGLHMLDYEGDVKKTEAFQIDKSIPEDNREDFFRQEFKARGLNFDFEYIRVNGDNFTFRPSTRVHYQAVKTGTGATVYKLEPDFFRRLMEIHKGHGGKIIRWLQTAFALALILVMFSGVYLAVNSPMYRKVLVSGFGIGFVLLVLGLL